ncbi:MAG: serine/threonine protein phosphatase [Magnetococcales bacterium]|nr:serine/threonine protein phosphatase [Magnetococcales bacterium]
MIAIGLHPYQNIQEIKGIPFPPGVRFQQILILGPPGVGKSTQIRRLGGWIEEGHLDLAGPFWWRSKALAFIPRELHLYLPFQGSQESLSVYSREALSSPAPLDFPRIRIPPRRDTFFAMDWLQKYVFEFLLPPPDTVFAMRTERRERHTHPVDDDLTLEQVTRQLLIFWNVAKHLHRCGMLVYIRTGCHEPPLEIIDSMDGAI